MILFRAKTTQAYQWKLLAELLHNNIRTACFQISGDGIMLRMTDTHEKLLIDMNLSFENFDIYVFEGAPIFIGVNMSHFQKLLSCIKKKDSIEFSIYSETPNNLKIKIIPPKDNDRVIMSDIVIQTVQSIQVEIDNDYDKPIVVSSSEYSKMCKDLSKMGSTINVSAKKFYMRFHSTMGNIYSRDVIFGEDVSDDDIECDYNQDFDSEKLTRISKIAGLGTNIQIYAKNDMPLLLRTNVGTLGKISIYIKSRDLSLK